MTMTPANIEILARYMDHKGYGLLDLAVMVRFPDTVKAMFRQAEKWWAHEQELQRRFNADAERVLKS